MSSPNTKLSGTTYASCPSCLKINKLDLSRSNPICGACRADIDLKDGILNANSQQLSQLIAKSPLPVITDFWAPWCGPCRSFAPTFERSARERAGRAVFVKVNTENDPQASPTFGVRGIPALVAFKNGAESNRLAGAVPYEAFSAWLQQSL